MDFIQSNQNGWLSKSIGQDFAASQRVLVKHKSNRYDRLVGTTVKPNLQVSSAYNMSFRPIFFENKTPFQLTEKNNCK